MVWSIPITGTVSYWSGGDKDEKKWVKVTIKREDGKPWKRGYHSLNFEFRLEDDEVWMEPPEGESFMREALDAPEEETEEEE